MVELGESLVSAIRAIAHGPVTGPGGLEALAMTIADNPAGTSLAAAVSDGLSEIATALREGLSEVADALAKGA